MSWQILKTLKSHRTDGQTIAWSTCKLQHLLHALHVLANAHVPTIVILCMGAVDFLSLSDFTIVICRHNAFVGGQVSAAG